MSKVKVHFIGMAGLRGCLPSYCDVFTTRTAAAEALADLHECGPRFMRRLRRAWFAILPPDAGNEYCNITECPCSEPWMHQDDLSKERWLRERGEEFGYGEKA